jgi:hypothetical protein
VTREKYRRPRSHYFCFLSLLVFCPPLFAQTAPLVERLRPDTIFYMEWRGAASLGPEEEKNHLLELLRDPDLALLLASLGNQIQKSSPKGTSLSPMLLADLASFLDNGVVVGLVESPDAREADRHGWPVANFLVYDATGKADLIGKWKALAGAGGKTQVDVKKYDFGGTSVEVRATSTGRSYSAQAGKYFVASDSQRVIEDLITRFSARESPTSSVTQLPEYAQIRKYVGDHPVLEFFGRIPDLSRWSTPANPNAKSVRPFVDNLHLEKVRVLGGGLSLEGEAARMRGAVLGDTSPGGPFDLAGTSSASFQTLAAISAAPAFSVSRINLPAAYQLFWAAVSSNLTAQNVQMMEGAAQGFLGMPIVDALRLFTGEIGSMTTSTEDGRLEQLWAVSIEKPDAVTRVVRALIGTMIMSEDSSGPTTYLDIAYPYVDSETHQRRRKFYYLAVTGRLLLAAPRKEMLRQAVGRVEAGTADPPSAGVFANPEYLQYRSRLPEKLSGLGASDIAALPWEKILVNFVTQANPPQHPPDESWLKPGVIARHLHISVSGWWKDSNGLYFDSYVQ